MLDLTPRCDPKMLCAEGQRMNIRSDPKKYHSVFRRQRLQCNRFPSLVFADVISVPGYLHSLSLPFQGSETGICMLR
jgi:hypothetical protein